MIEKNSIYHPGSMPITSRTPCDVQKWAGMTEGRILGVWSAVVAFIGPCALLLAGISQDTSSSHTAKLHLQSQATALALLQSAAF